MLASDNLPKFVFVNGNGEDTIVHLSGMVHRMRAVAEQIGRTVPPGSNVGLLYTSEPNLVVNWFGCLLAGTRPLVMQYPTRKQSLEYWTDSVRNTIGIAGLSAILADDHCAGLGLDNLLTVIGQRELDGVPNGPSEPFRLTEYSIIQLSSGTTGYRKALEFGGRHLARHVADYNAALDLTKADTIVSWLPLYHDMGYIACFVMPMMLGVNVVTMDPMVWVQRHELLYGAIERHRGTICYMPNFGFEVMAREGSRRMPTMRLWISCSETVSAETVQKFVEVNKLDPDRFAACYAMAENIFAVTIRRGLAKRLVEGTSVVSCGAPIPGVDLKTINGEVWVRSPTSLVSYIGGEDIRDADGFYPTGDLGEIADGELYVTGRKQDLLIQAGRKFMLSDIDLVLNQLYPDVRGRGVAVQVYDERLGTQKPLVLIETVDFFLRADGPEIAASLKAVTGLDQIEVAFVPPRFLTKTSSGKFNRRKSAEHWHLAHAGRKGAQYSLNLHAELRSSFCQVAWDQPVSEILDSLSLTVLRIILSGAGQSYDKAMTLNAYVEAFRASKAFAKQEHEGAIRIVSLAERGVFRDFHEKYLDQLALLLGKPVTLEHICLPPSPIVLSDLIFYDYFRPRIDNGQFAAMAQAFGALRDASLIITDDAAEMNFSPTQVYAVASHSLQRDSRADLISVRWQHYTQHHHEIPLTVVSGSDLPFEHRSDTLDRLGRYLGKPIYRLALQEDCAAYTRDWEYRSFRGLMDAPGAIQALDPEDFTARLGEWVKGLNPPVELSSLNRGSRLDLSDLAHFCSHYADQGKIDQLLDRFQSFILVGQLASVPYIRKSIERAGKPYVQVPSYSPEVIGRLSGQYDCMLICGAMGRYPITMPAAAIMFADVSWTTVNIDDVDLKNAAFTISNNYPKSGIDWYYPFEMRRDSNREAFHRLRLRVKAANAKLREEQLERWAIRDEHKRQKEARQRKRGSPA